MVKKKIYYPQTDSYLPCDTRTVDGKWGFIGHEIYEVINKLSYAVDHVGKTKAR